MAVWLVIGVAVLAVLALLLLAPRQRPTQTPHQPIIRLNQGSTGPGGYDELLRSLRGRLAERLRGGSLDWSRPIEDIRRDLRPAVAHLLDSAHPLLNRIEREKLISDVVNAVNAPG